MIPLVRVLAGLFFSAFLVVSASAHDDMAGDLVIGHAIIPATVKAAPVAAGYLEIKNNSEKPERLISVSTNFSKKSDIHTMKMVDGVMKMRPLKGGIEIKPGEKITLKKGGMHLMFMKLEEQMQVGQMRKATLVFENAGAIEVEMMVVDPSELEGAAMDHSDHTN